MTGYGKAPMRPTCDDKSCAFYRQFQVFAEWPGDCMADDNLAAVRKSWKRVCPKQRPELAGALVTAETEAT